LRFEDFAHPESAQTAADIFRKGKQALGNLYQQRVIELHESGIRLK
jgi:predicted RNA-binding protein (virulence factor B family)